MRISWSRIFIEEVDKGKIESKYKVLRFEILMFALFILWLLGGFATYYWFGDDRGTAGDMFGTVNALFSGLAFAGIIYTILLQRTELKFQREELELQRAEIRRSGDELEGQKKIMAIQRFENTFFQLLNLHHEIVGNMEVQSVDVIKGRKTFKKFYDRLEYTFDTRRPMQIVLDYGMIYREYEDTFEHYIRNLYHTIRWVHNANCFEEIEEKKEYIRIIKAQLSTYELLVLYYNCMTAQGEKLKNMAIEYELFDNLNYGLLIDGRHRDIFEEK